MALPRGNGRSIDEDFDYDQMPKRGGNYPTGYYIEEVTQVTKTRTDRDRGSGNTLKPSGSLQYVITCVIEDAGKATDEFEGRQVTHRFTIGTADDPDAEQPETWLARDNYDAQDLVSFLAGCKLIGGKDGRAQGRGKAPWIAIEEAEGCRFLDHMGERAGKDGATYQKHRYFAVGDREPGVLGDEGPVGRPGRQAAERPADGGDAREAAELPPRRRAR